jgi:iron complex transport system permease protein
MILLAIRLPRVLLGILIGAGLTVSGAAMQGLFRNPLADPGLIGVASGAALAVVVIMVMGATVLHGLTSLLGPFTLPSAAFLGGMLTTAVVYRPSQFAVPTCCPGCVPNPWHLTRTCWALSVLRAYEHGRR